MPDYRFDRTAFKMQTFKEADLESDKFILFSNLFNIHDAEFSVLKNRDIWDMRHEIKKRGIYMILFKRRD